MNTHLEVAVTENLTKSDTFLNVMLDTRPDQVPGVGTRDLI